MSRGTFALAAASALVAAMPAVAQDFGLHLVSAHSKGGYEAATVGAYVRMPSGLTAGVLRNSEGRASAYGAWTWETADRRWALTAGAITGYSGQDLSPLVVPSFRLPVTEKVSARLAYIPKPRGIGGSSAAHLSIEFSL